MASTTKRRFTDEFKRQAVALWKTSGRTQTEVVAELRIMSTMLRRCQRKQEGSGLPASPAAKPPVSTMASPADQATETARIVPARVILEDEASRRSTSMSQLRLYGPA